jgi:hypothetical protein
MRTLPSLCALIVAAAFSPIAHGEIFILDFDATVNEYSQTMFPEPGFGVGSVVSGHVEVDLATLPVPKVTGTLANYNYWRFSGPPYEFFLGTLPGLTMRLTVDGQTFSYDSTTLPCSSGGTPGVGLNDQEGNDRFGVGLRDGPREMDLTFTDQMGPTTLVNGLTFPDSLDLNSSSFHIGSGYDTAGFVWFDNVTYETLLGADVTSYSFAIVPEPSACLLLGVGLVWMVARKEAREKSVRP